MNRQSRFDAWYKMLGAGALGWPRGMVQGGRWGGRFRMRITCIPVADSCWCRALFNQQSNLSFHLAAKGTPGPASPSCSLNGKSNPELVFLDLPSGSRRWLTLALPFPGSTSRIAWKVWEKQAAGQEAREITRCPECLTSSTSYLWTLSDPEKCFCPQGGTLMGQAGA